MRDEVNEALQIDASAPLAERTIDITTTGRRSGERRRIEVVFNRVDDDIYLTGIPMPQPRAWYLNLEADPKFIFHVKRGVSADLPATATPILEPQERRRILAPIVESLARNSTPESPFPVRSMDEWVAEAPLVRVAFDD
jgi:deazaflavin-dependent oxidoreductase (nitroreductase family)